MTGVQRPDRLTVTVSHPGDFRPRAQGDTERFHRGLGLPLMLSLTDEVTIGCKPGTGTSVSLSMLLDSDGGSCSPTAQPAGKA